MEKLNKRVIGFDYLRVICMLWIILRHFSKYAGFESITNGLNISLNYFAGIFFFSGGDIANCVFILISGYLMYNKSFNFTRWIKLIMQVMFYSVFSWGIAILMGYEILSFTTLKYMFFPFRFNAYWFISTYIVLCPLFPAFSRMVKQNNIKELSVYLAWGGGNFRDISINGVWLVRRN